MTAPNSEIIIAHTEFANKNIEKNIVKNNTIKYFDLLV